MALEIAGKLNRKFDPVTGESQKGPWSKQEFLIETFDTYPKTIHCSVWGDKIDQLSRFNPGDPIRASINLESREYNGRYYTEVRVWKIDPFQAAAAPGAPSGFAQPGSYNPQQQSPQAPSQPNFQPAPSGGQNFFAGGEDDDLPF